MSVRDARRSLARQVGVLAAGAIYLATAPFACETESYSSMRSCRGFVAYNYSASGDLPPQVQALLTAIVGGLLVGYVVWLVTARPRPPIYIRFPGLSLLLAGTILFMMSMGGGMAVAAPILVPMHVWAASTSSPVMRWFWIVVAILSAFEAAFIYVILLG